MKTVLILIPAAFLIYWLVAGPAPAREKPAKPAAAPDFSLPDLNGRKVSLSDFKGKVVLLDFWATWCGPCLEELPDLISLHEKKKAAGFSMVGVSLDEERAALAPFVKEHKIPYPILWAGTNIPEGYSIPGTPTAFLISPDGQIVKKYFGPKPYKELLKDVDELLSLAPNLVK